MKTFRIILLSLAAACISCSKAPYTPDTDDWAGLTFSPVFGHTVEVETKAPFGTINGVNFTFDGSIFVYNHGTTTPHVLGYENLKAQVDAKWDPNLSSFGFSWQFYPKGVETDGLDVIGIMKGAPVDVYAYVPYTSGMEDISTIPFITSEQKDIMLAKEENIIVNSGTESKLLKFSHVQSCITLRVKTVFSSSIYISNVYVRNATDDFIAKSGSVNAKTGELKNLTYDKNWMNVAYYPQLQLLRGKTTDFDILIPPVADYDDPAGIEVYLKSRQNAKTEHFFLPPPPADADGSHPFKAGKRYIYEVTLDDFIMVSPNVTIKDYDTVPTVSKLEF